MRYARKQRLVLLPVREGLSCWTASNTLHILFRPKACAFEQVVYASYRVLIPPILRGVPKRYAREQRLVLLLAVREGFEPSGRTWLV